MKFIASCLKSKKEIVIDPQCSNDSDIESDQAPNNLPAKNLKPAISHTGKFCHITPIRRIPLKPPKRAPSHKIQQIEISDESQHSCPSDQQSSPRIYRQLRKSNTGAQMFKRKLVKVANKCKIEGKQYSSTECSICLDSLSGRQANEIGRLKCKHAFCYDCILQSSSFSSRCPYCRTPFSHINRDGEQIPVQPKDLQDDFDPYDEPCYVCGRNDDFDHLLECEYCEAAFCHTYCDNRLQSDVPPEESWYCLSCSNLLGNG